MVILVVLALDFYVGRYPSQVTKDPQVITACEINASHEAVGEPAYKSGDRAIEQVESAPTEKTELNCIESPRILRYFQDLKELEQWLEKMESLDIISNMAVQEIEKSLDCDDYALKLQEKALGAGYMMSFEIIHSGEYSELFKKGQIPDGTIHAINLVIIGNEVYYIEPATLEIAFVACLD